MNQVLIGTKGFVRNYRASLQPTPSYSGDSLSRLAASSPLQIGLLRPSTGGGLVELNGVPGYSRAPAASWTTVSTGELVNKQAVEFKLKLGDVRPTRVTLFSDGVPVMSGELTAGSNYPSTDGEDRVVLDAQAIRVRGWRG